MTETTPTLASTSPEAADAPLAVAERLLGRPVRLSPDSAHGANSRVLAIEAGDRRYALKIYPDWRIARHERCTMEWRSLAFLRRQGISEVPRPVAQAPEDGVLILEWIEGSPVAAIGDADLERAAAFLKAVFDLSDQADAVDFPAASEACPSGRTIWRQIETRRAAFVEDDAIARFLGRVFAPAANEALAHARRFDGFENDLATPLLRLCPADFGFHNALREKGGNLRFLDFDYFGWDDPVKVVADFILHPAMTLSDAQAAKFASVMAAARHEDPAFAARLAAYLPLYALRWALIVLNIYRRDRQDEVSAISPSDAARQIAKAEALVALARTYARD